MVRQTFTLISLALLATLMSLAGGCGRMQAASEVKPDGTLVRTLIFREAAPSGGGATGPNPMAMMGGGKLEDTIILPKGADWTISRKTREAETIVTATRTIAPGGTLTDDLGIRKDTPEPGMGLSPFGGGPEPPAKPKTGTKKKPGTKTRPKTATVAMDRHIAAGRILGVGMLPFVQETAKAPEPLLANTVTVREIAPGRLEYREVIKWRGALPKELSTPDEDMLTDIKKALPANLASDEEAVKKAGASVQKVAWQLFFGPGEPLLPLLLMNPDLAEYKLKARLSGALDRAFTEAYGDRLTTGQRKELVAKLTEQVGDKWLSKTQASASPAGGPPMSNQKDMGMPVAMLMRVRMPGRIVSTNGTVDPDTGEVLWTMYAWAPATGDIVLTAVSEK